MTEQRLTLKITEAVQLDRKIRELEGDLRRIKSELVQEAESRQDEHSVTDGGGKSWVRVGVDGCLCRVTFPAPSLKASLSGEGKTFEKIYSLAGAAFSKLFLTSTTYKPVPDFRSAAESLLGKDARRLVKAMTSETAPKVSFETKES